MQITVCFFKALSPQADCYDALPTWNTAVNNSQQIPLDKKWGHQDV